MEHTHEYVDLGLSVKWATCNVGATKPEEYGDYFAWGETTPKSTYDWETYKYCNGSFDSLTKYNNSSIFGTEDYKKTLELADDAARANWGGSWRMPTKAEQDELREKCTWTWTTQNGVKGCKVTSKTTVSLFSSPLRASATIVRSTKQAASATTGRVRATWSPRTSRMCCNSTQTTWVGTKGVGTLDSPFVQFASRIYCLKGNRQKLA